MNNLDFTILTRQNEIISEPSLQDIKDQIKQLQRETAALKAKMKKQEIASIVKRMRESGISIEEIGGALMKKQERLRKAPAIRYRNPETQETWTGRGRTPRWILEAEKTGKSRQQFAV